MTHTYENQVQEAIKFLKQWRWDDEELPIPNSPFGWTLVNHLDILIEHAEFGDLK